MRALACGAGGAAQGPGGSFERVPFRYAAQQALAERQATESARASARSGVAVTGPAGSPASGLPALTLSTPAWGRGEAATKGRLVGVVALEASFQRVVAARRPPPAAQGCTGARAPLADGTEGTV
jgi:hypothetical protein